MQPEPEITEYRGYEIKLTRSAGLIDAAYRRIEWALRTPVCKPWDEPPRIDSAWWTLPFQSATRDFALTMAKARIDMIVDKVSRETVCKPPPNPSWQVKDYQGKRKPVAVEGGAA